VTITNPWYCDFLRRLAVPILLALAVATAACGITQPETEPTTGASTAPSTSKSPPPTSTAAVGSPTPSAETPVGLLEVVGEGTPLEPGRYTYSPFEPRVTFRVGQGWEGGHTLAEFFDVFHGEDMAQGFARPAFVAGPDGRVDTEGLSPDRAMRALAAVPAVRPSSDHRATVGGLRAVGFSFSAPEGVELFGGPEGEFVSGEGRLRVMAVDVRGDLVLLVTLSLRGSHARNFALGDRLLRTVQFPA
jgi:hypothetical protein